MPTEPVTQDDAPDALVPDPVVAEEFHITLMTLWKWTRDSRLGFPPVATKIRNRNYRSRRAIDEFKAKMIERGMSAERVA
jgi:hypothetical protein